jgi:hypothetical protein
MGPRGASRDDLAPSIFRRRRSAEVTRLVACARRLRRSRSGEKSRNLLNRALRALSKDRSTAHVADSLARLSSAESSDLVAEAATALSPSAPVGARVKSLSIQSRALSRHVAWFTGGGRWCLPILSVGGRSSTELQGVPAAFWNSHIRRPFTGRQRGLAQTLPGLLSSAPFRSAGGDGCGQGPVQVSAGSSGESSSRVLPRVSGT